MERARLWKGGIGKLGWTRWLAAAVLFLTVVAGQAAHGEEATRIDLNTASAAELESLPGVGPSKAQAIIAHREAAPFKSADELIEVKGIGEKLYAQLKDQVTVAAAPGAAAQRSRAPGEGGAPSGSDGKAGRTASTAGAR